MDNLNQTAPPPKKGWLQKIAKILAWTAATVLVLAVLLAGAAYLLEGTIKARIIAEVNEQVTVPVKVDGGIDFSVFRHFPYGSLTFKKVSINDRLQKGKQLLKADEFSLLCNLPSLFSDRLEFTKVVVSGGQLNMYRNAAGADNFSIFKPATTQTKQQAIQLKRAQIKNVLYTYTDKREGIVVSLQLNETILKGNFNDADFDLDVYGKTFVKRLSANQTEYLTGKSLTADVGLQVNKAAKKYSFTRGILVIDGARFNITGFFAQQKNATALNFTLKNSGEDIKELFALMPEAFSSYLQQAQGSGEYSITANVKGNIGKNTYPSVNVAVDLKNSELKLGQYNKFLKKVNATARYEMDEKGNDKLLISNFDCTLNDLPFRFTLSLVNLSNPSFDFYADGVLHLSELATFIPDSVLQEPDGKIDFRKFHLKGHKSDFTNPDAPTLQGTGEFVFEGAEFRQNGITYGNINGLLAYDGQAIQAENFTLNFLSTDFSFTGSIDNLLPYAYNLSSKRQASDVVLGVNGKVSTGTFNLGGIIDAYDKKNRPAAQQKRKINIREIFSMRGNVSVAIKRFLYNRIQADDLETNLQLSPGVIRVNHLRAAAMGGEVKLNGLVQFTPANALNLQCDVAAADLDIPRIFEQLENFGQTTLTDKNLKGTIGAAVTLNATWLNYKELDMDNLTAIVDFNIKNGRLLKFEPLRAASKFIRVEELDDIRFADLNNSLKVSNRQVEVPSFEIKSSALNLIISGTHRFDNVVDYHFKINLHKVLAQKFNRNSKEVHYIEEDPYEGLNLFLSMTGPLSNPTIKYDKASAKNKMKEDFKKEKEELKNLLKGVEKKVDENEKKREEKYFDMNDQPVFMEFEEE